MSEITQTGGYLDVVDATLRAPRLEATSNIGIANTNPEHAFSVGSNLYVSTDSSNVITVRGNVVTQGVKVGTIEIVPSYDLAAVSNVGNVTANTIIFTNETQGFVATGNATIGSTLTISGFRITAAAAAEDDLEAITTSTQDKPNAGDTTNAIRVRNGTESTSFDTGALQVGTNTGANGGLGVAGNVHVAQGVYTQDLSVSGDVVSNLAVNTDDLFVDIVNSRVGIGKTEPTVALDVVGSVAVDTNTLFVDSVNNKVGIGVTEPGATLEVTGNAYVSSNLEVGTANLFVDTVNSRVGIGVTNPAYPLDVHAGGDLILRTMAGTGSGGKLIFGRTLGTGTDQEIRSHAIETYNGSGATNNYMKFQVHNGTGISPFTAREDVLFLRGDGNVGIGTDNPTTRLQVNGSSADTFGDIAYFRNSVSSARVVIRDEQSSPYIPPGVWTGSGGGLAIGAQFGDIIFYTSNKVQRATIKSTGRVGIGTDNPTVILDVRGSINKTHNNGYYFDSSTGTAFLSTRTRTVGIYADKDIMTDSAFLASSDHRIKKDILDVNDSGALDTFRLLKPKTYKYKDIINRGTETVYGFIAQDVSNVLPNSTRLVENVIPNIYELADVSESNVITLNTFNTSDLEANVNIIQIIDVTGTTRDVTITSVIDEHTIRVEEDLSEWTGSVDETGNVVAGNQLFVYGQRVTDFHSLNKSAIWTVATAALQEVDRQLQAEKAKVASLEARVLALESA